MKKHTLSLTFTFAAILSVIFLSGCGTTAPPTYDESGYIGTYYGKHYLSDSVSIRSVIGDPSANMIYPDTLIVTNGTDATDGKVIARSSLLSGGNIEINTSTGIITPVNLGNVSILSTTLTNTKITSGSTGIWNSSKTVVNTHLAVNVTYNFNGTDIPLTVNINGVFNKQ